MRSKELEQLPKEFELLTLEQTSDFLNVKISKLRSMVFKRQIPVLKLGGSLRFNKEDLKKWLNEMKRQAQGI